MELITVHEDHFISAPPLQKKSCEDIRSITTADELVRRYPEVFAKDLGTLLGAVHLRVDENAEPSVTLSRRVPTALREKFKAELDRLENLGVLAKVDEPTAWVSSVVIATKKSGALRICIDPRPLNQVLKRETHQLPILDDLMPELARAKIFSTVDLTPGYWHCVLDDESSRLTTFATPFGRYRWKRLPFGLSASSEIFQKRVSQALEGPEGILNITDDILIYGIGDTEDEARRDHDRKLEALLIRCRERGIALNKNKFKLRIPEVPFMGHLFTKQGLKIDPDKAKAVFKMPRPEDVEGVQRLNGFVNYLSKFLPRLADHMEPIRRLTRQDTEFNWTEEQENAFREVKRLAELKIQCDASKKGLGAALLQRGQPIAYTSRALTEIEQRYAQIEKEMLAIVFSLEKFNQYTFGRHVKIQSDHKPLESILKKPLACAPKRLQGMMMKLQKYDYEVQLREIQQATEDDENLQALKAVILRGWPDDRSQLPEQTTPYFSMRDELSLHDGVIFRGQRIVVPVSLRKDIKQKLRASHLGTESCLRRARETIFWPNMNAELKEMIAACETCRTYETSHHKESLMPHKIPNRPWEQVAVDLFELKKKEYMITVDYYSNFWEIDRLTSTTS
ncbi:Retrovirus-related Pol polyprotein from transposon 412 [Acropora cervicornis]|uniref:Retrovirus-related Pol polyprotein from transposon 412 n=1 Tax=Acropora cervicornis TaxID=6130 RepID=A0AAD9V7G8_ACRCE|nr:Retrovirus-related Pol polyprotein from transposon 412 [Acropora cervicornis]